MKQIQFAQTYNNEAAHRQVKATNETTQAALYPSER